MSIFLPGLERLSSVVLTAGAATTGAVTIPARDILFVLARITGYGGSDIASLRFNADSTAANYGARWITMSNAATPVLAGTNTTTGGLIPLGAAGITIGRAVEVEITNFTTKNKVVALRNSVEGATQGTFINMEYGWGQWFNTAAQITSIEMLTQSGQNMLTGSGFVVFGANF